MSFSETISQELEHAHQVCATVGETDPHCRAAWDAVEEVLAARSHKPSTESNFDRHCRDYPEAPECRIYED
ncbi:MAG: Calvin cycle protein CP12 [Cyanobacteria bacterium J06639_1]